NVAGDAQRPPQVEIALDVDLDLAKLKAHGLGDHLRRNLGTARKGRQQEVARTGPRARPADAVMRLGFHDRPADINVAGQSRLSHLGTFGLKGDLRGLLVALILLLDRLLQLSQAHDAISSSWFWTGPKLEPLHNLHLELVHDSEPPLTRARKIDAHFRLDFPRPFRDDHDAVT